MIGDYEDNYQTQSAFETSRACLQCQRVVVKKSRFILQDRQSFLPPALSLPSSSVNLAFSAKDLGEGRALANVDPDRAFMECGFPDLE